MNCSKSWALLSHVAIGALVLPMAIAANAVAQSSVVFMTADYVLNPPPKSKLIRFDNGTQTYGVNSGSPNWFTGLTVLNGELLVADKQANKIERFSPVGTYLGDFASPTNGPFFLESDSSGNVYSTQGLFGQPIATRFNSAGGVIQTFTSGAGEFYGIDADALGNVYIARVFNGSHDIVKYAPDGTFLSRTPFDSINPFDLAIDESGNRLFLIDQKSGSAGIKIFDISGATPALTGSISIGPSAYMTGVYFAPETGNIFAAEYGGPPDFASRGLEFSPNGTLLREYHPSGSDVYAYDIITFGAASVPEPSCVVLLAAGMIGLSTHRRRRRPA